MPQMDPIEISDEVSPDGNPVGIGALRAFTSLNGTIQAVEASQKEPSQCLNSIASQPQHTRNISSNFTAECVSMTAHTSPGPKGITKHGTLKRLPGARVADPSTSDKQYATNQGLQHVSQTLNLPFAEPFRRKNQEPISTAFSAPAPHMGDNYVFNDNRKNAESAMSPSRHSLLTNEAVAEAQSAKRVATHNSPDELERSDAETSDPSCIAHTDKLLIEQRRQHVRHSKPELSGHDVRDSGISQPSNDRRKGGEHDMSVGNHRQPSLPASRSMTMEDVWSYFRPDPAMTAWLADGFSKSAQRQAKHSHLVSTMERLLADGNVELRQAIQAALKAETVEIQDAFTQQLGKSTTALHNQAKFVNGVQKDLEKGFVEIKNTYKSAFSDIMLKFEESSTDRADIATRIQELWEHKGSDTLQKISQIVTRQQCDATLAISDLRLTVEKLLQMNSELAEASEKLRESSHASMTFVDVQQLLSKFEVATLEKLQGLNDTCEANSSSLNLILSHLSTQNIGNHSQAESVIPDDTVIRSLSRQDYATFAKVLEEIKQAVLSHLQLEAVAESVSKLHDIRLTATQQVSHHMIDEVVGMRTPNQEEDRLRKINRDLQEQLQHLLEERAQLQQDKLRVNSNLITQQLQKIQDETSASNRLLQQTDELAQAQSRINTMQQAMEIAEARLASSEQGLENLRKSWSDRQSTVITKNIGDMFDNLSKTLLSTVTVKQQELAESVALIISILGSQIERNGPTFESITSNVREILESLLNDQRAQDSYKYAAQEQKMQHEFAKLSGEITRLLDRQCRNSVNMISDRFEVASCQTSARIEEAMQRFMLLSTQKQQAIAASNSFQVVPNELAHKSVEEVTQIRMSRGMFETLGRPKIRSLPGTIDRAPNHLNVDTMIDQGNVEMVPETQPYERPVEEPLDPSVLTDALNLLNPSQESSPRNACSALSSYKGRTVVKDIVISVQPAKLVSTFNPFSRMRDDTGSIVPSIANGSLQRQGVSPFAHYAPTFEDTCVIAPTTHPLDFADVRPASSCSSLRRSSRAVGIDKPLPNRSVSARPEPEWTAAMTRTVSLSSASLIPYRAIAGKPATYTADQYGASLNTQTHKRKRGSMKVAEDQTPSQRAQTPTWSETDISQRPSTSYDRTNPTTSFARVQDKLAAIAVTARATAIIRSPAKSSSGKLVRSARRSASRLSRSIGSRDSRADERVMAERFEEELRRPSGRPVRKRRSRRC